MINMKASHIFILIDSIRFDFVHQFFFVYTILLKNEEMQFTGNNTLYQKQKQKSIEERKQM